MSIRTNSNIGKSLPMGYIILFGIIYISVIGIIAYTAYLIVVAIINAVKGPTPPPPKTRERFYSNYMY